MKVIRKFRGPFRFLSNFYVAPFYWKEKWWKTVEYAFQASKTDDVQAKEAIRNAPTASEAKKLGRSVLLVPNWEGAKVDIMKRLLYAKFTQRPHLKRRLLATGGSLLIEEIYWHDNFWGDCQCGKCASKPGKNTLGKLLMELRKTL